MKINVIDNTEVFLTNCANLVYIRFQAIFKPDNNATEINEIVCGWQTGNQIIQFWRCTFFSNRLYFYLKLDIGLAVAVEINVKIKTHILTEHKKILIFIHLQLKIADAKLAVFLTTHV